MDLRLHEFPADFTDFTEEVETPVRRQRMFTTRTVTAFATSLGGRPEEVRSARRALTVAAHTWDDGFEPYTDPSSVSENTATFTGVTPAHLEHILEASLQPDGSHYGKHRSMNRASMAVLAATYEGYRRQEAQPAADDQPTVS